MASTKSKKFVARKGRVSRNRNDRQRISKSLLSKFVLNAVKKEVKKSNRRPPRSVPVRLLPASFDRSTSVPQIKQQDRWYAFIEGPHSANKYAILPISEIIPAQRPSEMNADDRFRSYDSVTVKGVSLRLTISHAESVRVMAFVFPNGMRRDMPADSGGRPFVDCASIGASKGAGGPVSELMYEVMSKEQLMGMEGSGKHAIQNLGVHSGPFAVKRFANELFDWKSTDGSAFMSRFAKDEGRPVGKIYASVNGSKEKMHGTTFKHLFNSSSLMRTIGFDGQNEHLQGWVGARTQQLELYIKLNRSEKFRMSNGSLSVNERPLELFLGFDAPGSLSSVTTGNDIKSGAIMAADMEVYYA